MVLIFCECAVMVSMGPLGKAVMVRGRLDHHPILSKVTMCNSNIIISLRYLASGMSQKNVASYFCVGTTTVSSIIQEVCQAIWDVLGPVFLPKPTPNDWQRIADEFGDKWNFPCCLGMIDFQ